jgi:hypothetical protein
MVAFCSPEKIGLIHTDWGTLMTYARMQIFDSSRCAQGF